MDDRIRKTSTFAIMSEKSYFLIHNLQTVKRMNENIFFCNGNNEKKTGE